MSFHDHLAVERRARLAAERLLEQKQAELSEANQKIAAHARLLTDEIVEKRAETRALRGENQTVRSDLERAKSAVMIAERRLWDSLETIQDGFAVFDADERMVAANRAYLSAFDGLADVAPGVRYEDLLRLAAEEGIVDIGADTRTDWCARMLTRWRGGPAEPVTLRLWNNQFIKIIDHRTSDGDMVTLALNITGTIRRERALKRAREKAEAASRAKSAFLANMSHEIRTPMNGVVGMAEILLESALDDDQRIYVQTIRNSGEALLAIINDVLVYSKIEAQRLELHAEPFDLEATIQEVMTLLGPSAQEKGLTLRFDYDLFLPTRLVGDGGRIRQILTNLAGNAVKFTEKGHVAVRVVGRSSGPGLRDVVISVEDTGIGIAPEMQDHIFGEFNQVEGESDRRYDGTGLGLAITKSLVSLMQGEIWLESEPGHGSCFGFRITLPEAADAEARTVPAWIDRAFVLDEHEESRRMVTAQLAALNLPVVVLDAGRPLDGSDIGPRDILVLTDPSGSGESVRDLSALAPDRRPAVAILLTGHPGGDLPESPVPIRTVPLPVLRSDMLRALSDLPEPPEAARPGAGAEPSASRRMRVLAAEDNKTNQLVFEKMLRGLDIDLRFAMNGLEAVEAFDDWHPDILFTDISMPGMDGKEAARRIRARESMKGLARMPIVAMTAHAMDGDAEEILAAGIDHYLTKPLRKALLIERLTGAERSGIRPVQQAAGAGPGEGAGERAVRLN